MWMTAWNDLLRFVVSLLPETATSLTLPHGEERGGGGRGRGNTDVIRFVFFGERETRGHVSFSTFRVSILRPFVPL